LRHTGHTRALLAVAGVAALLGTAGVASAQDGGGVAPPSSGSGSSSGNSSYEFVPFGSRNLAKGMRGADVKTLNWLMRAVAGRGPLGGYFSDPTDSVVRQFQSSVGIRADGVVRRATRRKIAGRMRGQFATWYGPGLWGRSTACGWKLRPRTIGVAHKRLPCGTKVIFAYRGRWVRARVIDRGPYNGKYRWDLTKRAARKIGFLRTGAGRVRVAVVRR
jgi:rare lipoprotein A (peptidoglycan hydrolase)